MAAIAEAAAVRRAAEKYQEVWWLRADFEGVAKIDGEQEE